MKALFPYVYEKLFYRAHINCRLHMSKQSSYSNKGRYFQINALLNSQSVFPLLICLNRRQRWKVSLWIDIFNNQLLNVKIVTTIKKRRDYRDVRWLLITILRNLSMDSKFSKSIIASTRSSHFINKSGRSGPGGRLMNESSKFSGLSRAFLRTYTSFYSSTNISFAVRIKSDK